ncbi:ATP-binding protein [Holdemanella porci]|uniref:ATP-binding protein n=1 Tax=Holdemanella porci TaxID=2652276 RepID=UPI00388F3322
MNFFSKNYIDVSYEEPDYANGYKEILKEDIRTTISYIQSPVTANAILDRLLHHSHIISIVGPSYKTKDVMDSFEN